MCESSAYFADNSIYGFLLSASDDSVPGLDRLVVTNRNEVFPIRHVRNAAYYAIVRQKRTRARTLAETPRSHLAIVGAAHKGGQLRGMLTYAGHRVLVALQAAQERLGEYPLQLNGVQRLRVLPGRLEGVQSGIEVPRDCKRQNDHCCILLPLLIKMTQIGYRVVAPSAYPSDHLARFL